MLRHATIESLYLEEAQAFVDTITEKYVLVNLKYSWNATTGIHRFDICYADRNMWR